MRLSDVSGTAYGFRHLCSYILPGLLALAMPTCGGCGGADFPDVRVPAENQHLLTTTDPSPAPLAVPEDRPFAIHMKKSNQDPGPAGQAKGESDATPDGSAFCSVEAAKGGSAAAEFTLGQRIENRSTKGYSVNVDLQYDLKESLATSSPPARETTASVTLTLAVLDSRKRVVTQFSILSGTGDSAAGHAASHDQRSFTVHFDPQQSYDVLIYGKVEAATAAAQDAQARLELAHTRMRLTFTAAPTTAAGP